MTSICLYFQVHQPYVFRNYSFFDIGLSPFYENEDLNCERILKIARECYLPANQVLLDLIKEHKKKFKVSFSIPGITLDLFEKHAPEVIDSFQELAKTGCVDFLAETYNHTLSFLYSREEFTEQVKMQAKRIKELFGITPKAFRNTELIYNNEVAKWAEDAGYKVVLAEGADFILAWRTPNAVYTPEGCDSIKLLMRNHSLSQDISLRFSNQSWDGYPLTAEKYASWVHANEQNKVVNLFLNYESFGDYHKEETGIFDFLKAFPSKILENPNFEFKTVSELATVESEGVVNVPNLISWVAAERDLNAWLGNDMQLDSLDTLYAFEKEIKAVKNLRLLEMWRILQGAGHVQAMSTKWLSSPSGRPYQVPYESPYDAYINFMNIFTDISLRVRDDLKFEGKKLPVKRATTKTKASTEETETKTTKVKAIKTSTAKESPKESLAEAKTTKTTKATTKKETPSQVTKKESTPKTVKATTKKESTSKATKTTKDSTKLAAKSSVGAKKITT